MIENLDSPALKYLDNRLLVLDQRLLPGVEQWVQCQSPDEMCHIIRTLQVRGAPLIGIAAALALADFASKGASRQEVLDAAHNLLASRPTAVNLKLAMDRLLFAAISPDPAQMAGEAIALFREDKQLCDDMAKYGTPLIDDGDNLLTHCNTGSLVTTGIGTALGVIKSAWHQGKQIHVYVDETRPLLQGARLTAWELEKEGIPYTLICDNMAASLMKSGKIDKVFVGSDRIARNGDVANKIGTYNVAVIAKHHQVPFYVVAPYTTLDLTCPCGGEIPIEERAPEEVRGFASVADQTRLTRWAPEHANVYNPAFDVTPVELVTAIVLDCGVFSRRQLQNDALGNLTNQTR